MAPKCLFDSFIRKVGSINIVLGYLPSKITSQKLKEEEALFDFFYRSRIWDFNDIAIILS